MHLSLVCKRLECVDLKEKNSKQMYEQIKENTTFREKKIHCSFYILFKKNLIKNNLLKKIIKSKEDFNLSVEFTLV